MRCLSSRSEFGDDDGKIFPRTNWTTLFSLFFLQPKKLFGVEQQSKEAPGQKKKKKM
jgi:hypothetical protein